MVLKLSVNQNHLEGLLKQRLRGPHPQASDSVGVEWGLRIYISNKYLGDAMLLVWEQPI